MISSTVALAFGMAVHELATNAAKYGALSTDGRVRITWTITPEPERLDFVWVEKGGPQVAQTVSSGFGTVMIQSMLADQLKGELSINYALDGIEVRFLVPLSHLE